MFAFNISGEVDEMLQRYEKIVNSGGTCAMVSINSVGFIWQQKKSATKNNWPFMHTAMAGVC